MVACASRTQSGRGDPSRLCPRRLSARVLAASGPSEARMAPQGQLDSLRAGRSLARQMSPTAGGWDKLVCGFLACISLWFPCVHVSSISVFFQLQCRPLPWLLWKPVSLQRASSESSVHYSSTGSVPKQQFIHPAPARGPSRFIWVPVAESIVLSS